MIVEILAILREGMAMPSPEMPDEMPGSGVQARQGERRT